MHFKLSGLHLMTSAQWDEALKSIPEDTTSLDLSDNNLGQISEPAFTQLIKAIPDGVTTVNLSGNSLGIIRAAIFVKNAVKSTINYDLQRNNIYNKQIKELFPHLKQSNIQNISLDDSLLSFDVKLQLLDIFQKNARTSPTGSSSDPGLDYFKQETEAALIEWVAAQKSNFSANINAIMPDGFTILHMACKRGYHLLMKRLVELSANAQSVIFNNGTTPLMLAVENEHLDIVRELLELNVSVDAARSSDGMTALHLAAKNGNLAILEELIEKKADIEERCHNGASPLFVAAQNGHNEIIIKLLRSGCDVFWHHATDPTKEDSRHVIYPIFAASQNGHTHTVKLLLDNEFTDYARDPDGYSSLHIAAEQGNLDLVNLLLEYKAKVNATTFDGITPIYVAAMNGHLSVVVQLIQAGANVNLSRADGLTPLAAAAENGHAEVVCELLKAKAIINTNVVIKSKNYTPLYMAIYNNHLRVAEILCSEIGHTLTLANTDLRATSIDKLLQFLSFISQETKVLDLSSTGLINKSYKELIQFFKAIPSWISTVYMSDDRVQDRECEGKSTLTPLILACKVGRTDLAQKFIEQGEEVNQKSVFGQEFPLLAAADEGHLDIVNLLISSGADLNLSEGSSRWFGDTAFHRAIVKGHLHVASRLLQAGGAALEPFTNFIYVNENTLKATFKLIDFVEDPNLKEAILEKILNKLDSHGYNALMTYASLGNPAFNLVVSAVGSLNNSLSQFKILSQGQGVDNVFVLCARNCPDYLPELLKLFHNLNSEHKEIILKQVEQAARFKLPAIQKLLATMHSNEAESSNTAICSSSFFQPGQNQACVPVVAETSSKQQNIISDKQSSTSYSSDDQSQSTSSSDIDSSSCSESSESSEHAPVAPVAPASTSSASKPRTSASSSPKFMFKPIDKSTQTNDKGKKKKRYIPDCSLM